MKKIKRIEFIEAKKETVILGKFEWEVRKVDGVETLYIIQKELEFKIDAGEAE